MKKIVLLLLLALIPIGAFAAVPGFSLISGQCRSVEDNADFATNIDCENIKEYFEDNISAKVIEMSGTDVRGVFLLKGPEVFENGYHGPLYGWGYSAHQAVSRINYSFNFQPPGYGCALYDGRNDPVGNIASYNKDESDSFLAYYAGASQQQVFRFASYAACKVYLNATSTDYVYQPETDSVLRMQPIVATSTATTTISNIQIQIYPTITSNGIVEGNLCAQGDNVIYGWRHIAIPTSSTSTQSIILDRFSADYSGALICNPGGSLENGFLNQTKSTPDGEYRIEVNSGIQVSGPGGYKTFFLATRKNDLWSGFSDPTSITTCTQNCYSNVLFFPGIMGSRLYSGSDKLWDTLAVQGGDTQQARLAMDTNGYSIENIHTGADTVEGSAVIDTVAGQDIYKSFIQDLSKWTNQDKLITDYAVIPYDWRLPLDQIVQKGKEVDGKVYYGTTTASLSDSFIVQQLQRLVDSSKSGKVTIIAHSNGGLVTKELIQTLKETNNPLYDKIDKIIMVAVPQVGTPEVVLSILHGKEVGLVGAAINQKRMRSLAENMPMSYNLLPNQNYLDALDSYALDNKVVTFDDSDYFKVQQAVYGNLVNNQSELQNFITGSEGRYRPTFTETTLPNIGNDALYSQANSTHQRVDNFEFASTTKIIQVAGWGEDTVVGIDYKSYLKEDGSQYPSFKVRKVVDGDGTVVVPSALYTSTSNSNVERWWVDLKQYKELNRLEGLNPLKNKNHSTLLEIPELRSFIQFHIQNQSPNTSQIIKNTQPSGSDVKRLHYTLHSPLTLGILDQQGRYSGRSTTTQEVINQIEGVNYDIYGEVQTISVPVGLAHTVVLDGYETGSFSLDIDKQEGNTITASTTFSGIPTTSDTTVTLAMSEQADIATTQLQVDSNSDGRTDITLQAVENSQVIYQKPKDTPVAVSYGGGGGGYYTPQLSTSTSTPNQNRATPAASIIKEATTSTSTEKIVKNTVKPVQKKVTKVTKPTPQTITKKQQPEQTKLATTNKVSQVATPVVSVNTYSKESVFTKIKNGIKRVFGVQ